MARRKFKHRQDRKSDRFAIGSVWTRDSDKHKYVITGVEKEKEFGREVLFYRVLDMDLGRILLVPQTYLVNYCHRIGP